MRSSPTHLRWRLSTTKKSLLSRFRAGLKIFVVVILSVGSLLLASGAGEIEKVSSQFQQYPEIEVDYGNHRITYRRIPTPHLVERSLQDVSPTTPETAPVEFTRPVRPYEFLALWCTVHRDGLSLVELDMGGETVRFWSSADFGLLAHVQDLSLPEIDYSLFVMVWETGAGGAGEWTRRLGLSRQKTGGSASVWQIEAPGMASAKAQAAIRALHSHLDSHNGRLAAEQAELQKLSDKIEFERKQEELRPPDQVIEFFPIRSRHSSEPPKPLSDQ